MPKHPLTLELIRECGFPLCAPSANRFGKISPTSSQAVLKELGDRIDWILDGGECSVGIESTIIQLSPEGELTLLRAGGLALELVETLLAINIHRVNQQIPSSTGFVAPGMMSSHYAPKKPCYYLNEDFDEDLNAHEWILQHAFKQLSFLKFFGQPQTERALIEGALSRVSEEIHLKSLDILSEEPDFNVAAQHLFSTLRKLDEDTSDAIIIERCPNLQGLGLAIDDRLKRASAKQYS
jgi:L-threonylcarbamoyladenylate synthase